MQSLPKVLLMGQTPPPWHGQAVATQILFDHDWPGFNVHRLRMEFSEEMSEVGRFQWKKVIYLFQLTMRARKYLKANPGTTLFYPPASARWVPFLRDVFFLGATRHLAGATVFIFHASGLPVFTTRSWLRRRLAKLAYEEADESLEVAIETITPHEVFHAKRWSWCPCAIEVPEMHREKKGADLPTLVLFLGSLQEGKGVLEILRTANELNKRGRGREFRFQIVGKWFSSEFEEETIRLRTELGVQDSVELTGQLTGADKWDAYAKADVFFFPTHYASEASPIVLMEALGAGLPIISTEWAGIPAMLDGCESTRLLPIRSPSIYADELISFRENSSGGEKLSAASKEFYGKWFRPERFVGMVASAFARSAESLPSGFQEAPEIPGQTVGIARTIIRDRVLRMGVYLADQNPRYDRSLGIARMSEAVLNALAATGRVDIFPVCSTSSQQGPETAAVRSVLPFGTRGKSARLLADHFHLFFARPPVAQDLWYYPKGFLPWFGLKGKYKVVTIHDTIIQHYRDNYPSWRNRAEYVYWARMLANTIEQADAILTVSKTAKKQIEQFMDRHGLTRKPVTVTFEPCIYEVVPQPFQNEKGSHVIHLASPEPHKRTTHLLRWWADKTASGHELPPLHLVGKLPPDAAALANACPRVICRPFLEDSELRREVSMARALILPSEIEGFGLPALEAYYLGTPVCFVAGTSVEEILLPATNRGRFHLHDESSFWSAFDDVLAMEPLEVREAGLKLREVYASSAVAARMLVEFERVGRATTTLEKP
ncbi:MAG: glycosyltransferase [Verrucomicrobiales bacterium]